MTPDRPSFPRALRLAIALALAAPAARAQLPPQTPQGLDQQQFTKAQGLYEQGKYADAVPLFEGIQGNFPTSPYIPAANLQAGVCHYFLGQYDQGVAALRKNLAGKGVTAEVIEDTQALIPQLLTAKAQKMPAGDPTRKTTLESAVKEFDTFIKNFPQSREVEQANLGKARAYYGLENFDEAAKPLRTNIEKYPTSESAMDSQYMLALIQSTHGNEVMRKKTAPEEEKAATAAYEEAEKVFTGIIQKRTDLAMMNDSQFQLGEMLASRGSYEEKGEKQDRILYRSLDAYRNTFPKEAVVLAQKFRIKNFQDKMREAGTKADVQGLRYYQNLIQREQAKLTDLESRADQTLEAKLKSGRIYLQLHKDKERERMDEARVLFHFVEKFTEDAEQKKQILYNLTLTYAVQHVVEKAEESYKKWVDAFQKDPVGENLPLLMGAMYLDSDPKRNNPQKAIEYFDRQVAEFPTSKFAGDATMQKALAMIQLKQFDAGASALTDFLAKSPSKDQAVVAEFGLAIIYKDTNKVDLAIECSAR